MIYTICYLNADDKMLLAKNRAWTRKGAMKRAIYARDNWHMTAQIYRRWRLLITVQRDHVTIFH